MVVSKTKIPTYEKSVVYFLDNYLSKIQKQKQKDLSNGQSIFCKIKWNNAIEIDLVEGVSTPDNLHIQENTPPDSLSVIFDLSTVNKINLRYIVLSKIYGDLKEKAPSLSMKGKSDVFLKVKHDFGLECDLVAIDSAFNSLKKTITWDIIKTQSFNREFSAWYQDVFLNENTDDIKRKLYASFVNGFNNANAFSFKRSSLEDVVAFFEETKDFVNNNPEGVVARNKMIEKVLAKFLKGVNEDDLKVLSSLKEILGHDSYESKVFKSLKKDFEGTKSVGVSFLNPVEHKNKLISLNKLFFKKGFEKAFMKIFNNNVDIDSIDVNIVDLQKKVLSIATHPYMLKVSGVEKFDLVNLDKEDNLCVLKVSSSFDERKLKDLMLDIMDYLSNRLISISESSFTPFSAANPFGNFNNPKEQENLRAWCKMKSLNEVMSSQNNIKETDNKDGMGFKI